MRNLNVPNRICLTCGKEFIVTIWNKKYCSKACYFEELLKKKGKERDDTWKRKKSCFYCGQAFYPKAKNQIYCSQECCYKTQREDSLTRYDRCRDKTWRVNRKCVECMKLFLPIQINQKYCSKKCRYNSEKRKCRGGRIIKRKDGAYYNWNKLRFEIFKRDNFTCQYCGRNVKEDKVKLHTDHIIPKSKGGKDVANNLITSCEDCNLGKGDVLLEGKELCKHN